jgi:hypothetical protein
MRTLKKPFTLLLILSHLNAFVLGGVSNEIVFISLNLFTSLIAMADINDDIQRKQAQDRQQLELEKSLIEQLKLKTKQQVMPRQEVKPYIADLRKCINIKQINTSKQNLIDTQLVNDFKQSNTKRLIILLVIINNNLGVVWFFTKLNAEIYLMRV